MVDYSAMWIHQRTGPNTGVSYRLGTVLLGLFMLVGLIGVIGDSVGPGVSVFLVVAGALGALAYWGVCRWATQDEREYERLAEIERMEIERDDRDADFQRLRSKYRA